MACALERELEALIQIKDNVNQAMDAGSTNLNKCLHRTQNLGGVLRSITVRRLVSTISCNSAHHFTHQDSVIKVLAQVLETLPLLDLF
jgi:S-adenosylhomocysteine hydrolase